MVGLTQRQAQTLEYIRQSIEERGYPPTLREIGEYMGIRSTNGVNDHLRALERKGYLRREDMKSRALRLVNETERAKSLGPAAALAASGVASSSPPYALGAVPPLTNVAANLDGSAAPDDQDAIEVQVLGRVA